MDPYISKTTFVMIWQYLLKLNRCMPYGPSIPLLYVMLMLSHVSLCATPWTITHQAPLSMGFSRQEYWSQVPFPSLGDLPDPGIEPRFPALQADALTSEPPGKPTTLYEWWVLRFSVYHNTADYKMKIIHNTAEFDFKIFYGLKNQLVPTPNTLLI